MSKSSSVSSQGSQSPRERPKKYRGMLRIGEAAERLGVSSETLRNWDRWGWLRPVRNPLTGYRYYTIESIEEYLANYATEEETHRC